MLSKFVFRCRGTISLFNCVQLDLSAICELSCKLKVERRWLGVATEASLAVATAGLILNIAWAIMRCNNILSRYKVCSIQEIIEKINQYLPRYLWFSSLKCHHLVINLISRPGPIIDHKNSTYYIHYHLVLWQQKNLILCLTKTASLSSIHDPSLIILP